MPAVKASVKRVVEEADTRAGRRFDYTIQLLVVLSLVSFSIETLPDLSTRVRTALRWFEVFTIAVFTVEYVLRVWVADRKLEFVRSFFGVVDLAAILPFYLALGLDLRSIRLLRLVRLLRVLKLARYNAAIRRLRLAAVIAKEEIFLFLGLAAALVYVAAVGVYYFEHEAQPEAFASVFHGM